MSKRRNREEMFSLIEQWECGTQPRNLFCEAHGVPLGTFSYWRAKYIRENASTHKNAPPPPAFVQLQPQLKSRLEVTFPNGVTIKLPVDAPLSEVKALVELF